MKYLLPILVLLLPCTALADTDAGDIEKLTVEWLSGWSTSPEKPFTLDNVAHLYVKDDSLVSFDFGRPFDGVRGWAHAAEYYPKFMAQVAYWKLNPNDDMEVTVRGDIAWSTVSLSAEARLPDGTEMKIPEGRVTLIFERRVGGWLIVHEHGSAALPFPNDPEKL